MPDRPNVLFFFTDDQRFDTIAALGNPDIHTPNLDRLLARGTAFTQAHIPGGTSGAVCMPSRAMLHTGRSLFHLEGAGHTIPTDHTLLGEHLQQAGYTTFGCGKWHNGTEAFARSFNAGAEIFFGGMMDHWNMPANDYDPTGAYDHQLPYCPNPMGSNDVQFRNADHITAGAHSTDLLGGAVSAFLRNPGEAPFFAYVSFLAPHDPRTMPAEFLRMYDPDTLTLDPNVMGAHPFDNGELKVRDEKLEDWPRTPEAVRRHLAEYYAMITHLDARIGDALRALEESGQAENTIVCVAGDNGLAVGRHGLMGKQSLYDHSVRVPLLLAGPGIPQGELRSALCYLHDLFPTFCELAGLDVPASVEGRSLVPLLQDPQAPGRERLYLAYRHLQRGIREGNHKLIEYVAEGRRTTQLFDLAADPWEVWNLAEMPEYTDTVARLRESLVAEAKDWDDPQSQWGQTFWQGFEA